MVEQEISCFKEDIEGGWLQIAMKRSAVVLQVGGKAMHELDYSSRLCTTRHPLCSILRGYLIASALLP